MLKEPFDLIVASTHALAVLRGNVSMCHYMHLITSDWNQHEYRDSSNNPASSRLTSVLIICVRIYIVCLYACVLACLCVSICAVAQTHKHTNAQTDTQLGVCLRVCLNACVCASGCVSVHSTVSHCFAVPLPCGSSLSRLTSCGGVSEDGALCVMKAAHEHTSKSQQVQQQ
jgi:hypothetical protein